MRGRQCKDGEGLRQVFFHPGGQPGRGLGVIGGDFLEATFGAGPIRSIEDAADGRRHGGALIQPGHVGLGVLLQMKLAALPGHRSKDGGAGRAQPGVVVAGDQLNSMQAALLEAGEEGAPMDFGFAQGGADAQDGAFALGADAQGDEDGAVEHTSALADFFVTGIQVR